MRNSTSSINLGSLGLITAALLGGLTVAPEVAYAQEKITEEIVVTGSRIRQDPLDAKSPVVTLTAEDIKATGLTSAGDVIQRLTVSGSALNTRFNSSGNFGFPPDGSGVGAGSSQVDLRHLGSKRTLVLVDGIRWISESSASGVGAATDLNTIPVSIIERIEVLTDGASAIYGSDAIAGVVNVITKKEFEGLEVTGYFGQWDEGDGDTDEYSISLGTATDRTSVFINGSYTNQARVRAADRAQSRESAGPGTSNLHGSSGTPQGRQVFPHPTAGFINCTINDGAVPAPGQTAVFFDPLDPCGPNDDFHPWTNADRFNFAPFNLVVTPSERWSIFGQGTHEVSDNVDFYLKALFNSRKSTNQAAPEPLFLNTGAGGGGLMDQIGIDVTNPFNPFGVTLPADNPDGFITRRPLEGGPRVFNQDVDTWYFGGGFQGDFDVSDRSFFWDLNTVWSQNQANQTKTGGYNARKLLQALGPLDDCLNDPGALIPTGTPCVPFNMFGGQGADGMGTITQEMLDFVAFTQQDSSEQELFILGGNISGGIVDMPAGPLGFAVGFEHREQDGSFQPDAVVVAGDTAGLPAQPTSGGFDVDEFYLELNVPILSGVPGADLLDLSLAVRNTDVDILDDETTSKLGVRWRPSEDLLLRGTFAEGFRAPSIGELFGSQTRFDATLADPCSDFLNTGVAQTTIDNCVATGVPMDGSYVQSGGQISVLTGGNDALKPETSDGFTISAVYGPTWVDNVDWIDGLSFELNYYDIEVTDAIEPFDAQSVLDTCAEEGDPFFCSFISRIQGSGTINAFENRLANVGEIETTGWDLNIVYNSPDYPIGQFVVGWSNSLVDEFTERLKNPQGEVITERNLEGVEVNDTGIPEWTSNLEVGWAKGDWSARWTLRYIDELTEDCSDFLDGSDDSLTNLGLCSSPDLNDNSQSMNKLDSTIFNDFQGTWSPAKLDGNLDITLGINNAFDEDPPACYSCSLNGYDPSNYDSPGQFWYISAVYRRQ